MSYTDRARGAEKPRSRSFPARGMRRNQAQSASSGSRASKKEPAPPAELAIGIGKARLDFSKGVPGLAAQPPPTGTSLESKEWPEICAARPSNISTPCRNGRSGCSECSAERQDNPCGGRIRERAAYGCRG